MEPGEEKEMEKRKIPAVGWLKTRARKSVDPSEAQRMSESPGTQQLMLQASQRWTRGQLAARSTQPGQLRVESSQASSNSRLSVRSSYFHGDVGVTNLLSDAKYCFKRF